jgi:hypothetical protein
LKVPKPEAGGSDMDIEFHYYITYLIAAKAGFGFDDAYKIAYASQYVDDNDMILEIDKGKGSAYRNYISQTMNILKPKNKLFRIYPLFHFIPGDPMQKTAFRKDGKMHWLNTTPNSKNGKQIFDNAIETTDLYRIGVALHSYADTWAHQNFVGYYDGFNSMDSPLGKVTPNIGHADAQHNPDWPALVWRDDRLKHERRENKTIYLEAARKIFQKLVKLVEPMIKPGAMRKKALELLTDLDEAIGGRDQTNENKKERIARYCELSLQPDYGDTKLPKYDDDRWIEDALNENVRGLRDRSDFSLARYDPFNDIYTWKNRKNYKSTDWFHFQTAVKDHQNKAWEILSQSNLKGLQLPRI